MPRPHVAIVGAGIGGLAAAVSLQKAGCTVEIHERAAELRPVGAGLTVQPNAVLALRHLGVGDRVERAGRSLRLGGLHLSDGTSLGQLPEADARALLAEVGAPVVGIHRATLHEILLDAAGRACLHLGRSATGWAVDDHGATLHFDDGSTVRAAAVVGADGVHSACRRQLLDDGEPVYSGYFCWRGIAPGPGALPDDWGGEIWGDRARFGGCAIDGGRLYWFAVAEAPPGGRDPAGGAKVEILELFHGFSAEVLDVIRSTPEAAIFRTDIHDRPPVTTWGRGRLTLLGDAAHAMTPNLGQGACQAIEDALVLGTSLAGESDVPAALRRYEALRQPRANAVVTAARRFGEMSHWRHPAATFVRDSLLRLMPTAVVRRQLAEAWSLPYAGFEGP